MGFSARYAAFDRFQQRHGWLGFPLAVRQKYADDQAGYLAASITYYGFFSIFPALLVLVSGLGFVLRGHASLRNRIVGSALAQFPVVGHDLTVNALHGSVVALVLGLAGAVWAGMGVCLAAENAMNHLWDVPFKERPDAVRARLRALALLVVFGLAVLATTALSAAGTAGESYGIAWKLLAVVASVALNIGIFWVAFRLMTVRDIPWRDLRGGAIAAGIAYEVLLSVGAVYLNHVVKHASNTYGTFGLVLGLLTWIYLAVHVTLLAAEGNVVASRRLWPRSFSVIVERPTTGADERALVDIGRIEERRSDEQVDVTFRR